MPDFSHQLTHLLRRKGCPFWLIKRLLEETEDHREALLEEAREDGLSETEARKFAEQCLGSAEVIAARYIQFRKHRDWWGRHPLVLFGILPLILLVLGCTGGILAVASWGNLKGWWNEPSTLDGAMWLELNLLVPLFLFCLVVFIPALICRWATHYLHGWKWALVGCVVLAVHSYFHFFVVEFPLPPLRGQITWGYGYSNDWDNQLWKTLPPLLIFSYYFFQIVKPVKLPSRANLNPLPS